MNLVNIISVAAFAVLLSRYLFPPVISFILKVHRPHRPIYKPWECGFCLSWWIGLAVFIPLAGWWGLPFAAMSAVCGSLIDRYV